MVERNLTGGTCVNFGCTPSKALLRAARAVYQAREGQKFGYALQGDPRVDFAAVMTRVREMRAFSGSFDAVSVAAAAGIDVSPGDGRFVGPDAVEVDGQRLRFRRALIATGSGPAVPDVPGLATATYFTNETVFELTRLPRRVVCVGAGIVNCELAQALRRLGSEVDRERRPPHAVRGAGGVRPAGRAAGDRRGTAAAAPACHGGGRRAGAGHAARRHGTPLRCRAAGDRPPCRG